MKQINDYVYFILEGKTRQGQIEDLGDERMNRMLLLLDSRSRMMEERTGRKIDRGTSRFIL